MYIDQAYILFKSVIDLVEIISVNRAITLEFDKKHNNRVQIRYTKGGHLVLASINGCS